MTTTTRVVLWLVATALLSFTAGIAVANGNSWWSVVTAVVAALCALGAGIQAALKHNW